MKLTALLRGAALSVAIIGNAFGAAPFGLSGSATIAPNAAMAPRAAPKAFQGYYEQTSQTFGRYPPKLNGGCLKTSDCTWAFKPVPKTKQLLVTRVSCLTAVSAGDPTGAVVFSAAAGGFGTTIHPLSVPTKAGGLGFLSLNSSALHLFNPGERPAVELLLTVTADWNSTGFCTISGLIFNKP